MLYTPPVRVLSLNWISELAGYVSPSPKPEESPSMNVNSDPAPEVYNESVTGASHAVHCA